VNLKTVGTIGPNKKLDLSVKLQFPERSVGIVPLVGEVFKQFSKYVGKVLSVQVRGTTDNPSCSLL
jgi:hypothetical protein